MTNSYGNKIKVVLKEAMPCKNFHRMDIKIDCLREKALNLKQTHICMIKYWCRSG
jgi:hypothetical protein